MLVRFICTGLLVIGVLAIPVLAQRGGGGGGSNGGGANIPAVGFNAATRFDRLSDALKLNKEQKKEVKATLDDAQKTAAPVHEQIMNSRQAIAEAVAAGKSQDEIKQLVNSSAVLDARMAGIELKAFARIYQGLDKDQRTRTAPIFMMMKGLFNGKNWNSSE